MKSIVMNKLNYFAIIILLFIISSCGGGDSNEIVTNAKPVVSAGVDQTVTSSDVVILTGSGSDIDGSNLDYRWSQVDGNDLVFNDSDNAITQFIAPIVVSATNYEISLTVSNYEGVASNDSLIVTVNPKLLQIPMGSLGLLNDTGSTSGGDYPSGGNIVCIGEMIAEQDCSSGRDAAAAAGQLTKVGGGQAGFDFTKLDINGSELIEPATSWACVRDNHTGIIWEVKINDGGIHDKDNGYRWGGKTASLTGTFGTEYNDWDILVDGANAENYCGFNDWRVPTRGELRSIINYNRTKPAIDTSFFPNAGTGLYWSSSPVAYANTHAWGIAFSEGKDLHAFDRSYNLGKVRLVRSGK